ncbi:RecA-superfamily ATPase possibly involved in signal transduction [Thermoplasmatales archaeon SCGC AB-539-N05]|nr:RecA-superfamily ATPase possibly involved in signal transduction [Thermoplasmatales archaeon SCGC AB-539-N05]
MVMDQPRCKTGIGELDNILKGGIPVGDTILVVGTSGSGKTTMCMQFLANGAKVGEKGIFFTITEPLFKLTKNLQNYEFYDKYFIDSGITHLIDLRIICERMGLQADKYTFEDASALLDVLKDITNELKVKRLVIDSITALCHRLPTKQLIRDFIFKLGSHLAAMDCTALLTSEVPPNQYKFSVYEIEEFISDGIIFLGDIERGGDFIRTLQVVKMRGTEHLRTKYAVDISHRGLTLSPLLKTK